MTEQDTGQRRRAEDSVAYRAPRRSSGASFLKRFKKPIIGLSLAGAAAPLINATSPAPDKAATSLDGATEADLARQAAALKVDAEDAIASRIAAENTTENSGVVKDAIDEYKIESSLANDIYEIAHQEGIDPKLAYGLVHTESSFKTKAESGVGARGLTQVMPKTAKWLAPGTKADDLWDQKTNLKLGFRYLNQLIDKYHGNVRHALLAYNRGPGTVDRILKRGGDPNNGYADKVIGGSKFGT
jgi:soluble lytic murein transglycosylase-like protein